jgi:hypothetical protein
LHGQSLRKLAALCVCRGVYKNLDFRRPASGEIEWASCSTTHWLDATDSKMNEKQGTRLSFSGDLCQLSERQCFQPMCLVTLKRARKRLLRLSSMIAAALRFLNFLAVVLRTSLGLRTVRNIRWFTFGLLVLIRGLISQARAARCAMQHGYGLLFWTLLQLFVCLWFQSFRLSADPVHLSSIPRGRPK